jgi:hypothetical protein
MAATFVVEDGNGLPNANAYVPLVFSNDYFASRGVASWALASDADKQTSIVRATDYIETVWGPRFLGAQAFAVTGDPTIDQALSFPRDLRTQFVGNVNYVDVQYMYTSSQLVANPLPKPVAMPLALLKACCEYANRALLASLLNDPVVDPTGAMVTEKTETIGPITEHTSYFPGFGIQVTQPYPAADLLLRPLITVGGRTIRG